MAQGLLHDMSEGDSMERTWDLVPYHLQVTPITYKWFYTRSKITLMAL